MASSPEKGSHVISTFGREIDSLFIIILCITGIVFIGTQIVFVMGRAIASPTSATPRGSRSGQPSTSTAASGSR